VPSNAASTSAARGALTTTGELPMPSLRAN
jgi:hypothetical protein